MPQYSAAHPFRLRLVGGMWAACALCAAAPAALADVRPLESAPSPSVASASAVPDPEVVITRRVQPRIAYRGVPLEANPVAGRASVFPRQVFHGAMDNAVDVLAGDEELGARATSGLQAHRIVGAVDAAVAPVHLMTAGPHVGSGAAPLGEGARAGSAVNGATANLGSIITGALAPVMSAGNGP